MCVKYDVMCFKHICFAFAGLVALLFAYYLNDFSFTVVVSSTRNFGGKQLKLMPDERDKAPWDESDQVPNPQDEFTKLQVPNPQTTSYSDVDQEIEEMLPPQVPNKEIDKHPNSLDNEGSTDAAEELVDNSGRRRVGLWNTSDSAFLQDEEHEDSEGIIGDAARICEAEVSCICQEYVCPLFCALAYEGKADCLKKCEITDSAGERMTSTSDSEKWKAGYLNKPTGYLSKLAGGYVSPSCGRFGIVEGGREADDKKSSMDRKKGDDWPMDVQLMDMGIACIAQVRDPEKAMYEGKRQFRTGRRARDWTLMESPSWRNLTEKSTTKALCMEVISPSYNGLGQCKMPGFEEWKKACADEEKREIPCHKDREASELPECKDAAPDAVVTVTIQSPSGGNDDCADDAAGTVETAVAKQCRGITGIKVTQATPIDQLLRIGGQSKWAERRAKQEGKVV